MAEIKDCIGKNVKISKTSITIKLNDGKTCGVVRDIRKFHDIQTNKQTDYFRILKKSGAWGNKNFDVNNCVEKDGKLYVFRSLKSKLFHEKYGYFSEEEKKNSEEQEVIYSALETAGINVIECIFV